MASVVCGVNPTEVGRQAARVGSALAGCVEGRLLLIHAMPVQRGAAIPAGVPDGVPPAAHAGVLSTLERLAAELSVDAECRIVEGDPRPALVEAAGEADADWIVVGCRGRNAVAAAAFGEMPTYLARRGPCPVVVVPPGVELPHQRLLHGRCVVAGVADGGEAHVVDTAVRLAQLLRCPLTIVHAVEVTGAVPAAVALGAPGLVPEVGDVRRQAADHVLATAADAAEAHADAPPLALRVDAGGAATALRTVAREHGAAAVVVGSRGRGPLLSGLLGSTSRALCCDAPCPVVVCPDPAG